MVELVVVAPLSALVVGNECARTEWPPHVTVLPNVWFEGAPPELARVLRAVATSTRSMDVTLTSFEWFGPGGDIAVLVIQPDARLTSAHAILLGLATELGATPVVPGYNAGGYRAHISVAPNHNLEPGDRVRLSSLALVELSGPSTRVIASELLVD
ncbi:MAG TPA: 2'-5' RNA ligase family protein [Galbitalea sp.]